MGVGFHCGILTCSAGSSSLDFVVYISATAEIDDAAVTAGHKGTALEALLQTKPGNGKCGWVITGVVDVVINRPGRISQYLHSHAGCLLGSLAKDLIYDSPLR